MYKLNLVYYYLYLMPCKSIQVRDSLVVPQRLPLKQVVQLRLRHQDFDSSIVSITTTLPTRYSSHYWAWVLYKDLRIYHCLPSPLARCTRIANKKLQMYVIYF